MERTIDSMSAQEQNTEILILQTAHEVFVEKGFDGARMQEIADRAGINKSLLHYYYRSKEKLFEAILQESFSKIVPRIFMIMSTPLPLAEKIEGFVKSYIDLLTENPHLPSFVLHELYRNPDRISRILVGSGLDPKGLLTPLAKQMKMEHYPVMEPQQLMVNLLALCIFPFIARPILETILFEGDRERYQQFLDDRKQVVTQFILNALRSA